MICLRWPGFSHRSVPAVLLVAAAIAACGEGGTGEAPRLAIDTTGVKVVLSDPLDSDAHCSLGDEPVLVLGTDQGDPPYMLYWVGGAARLSDGSIAVLNNDTGEVRIFGPGGLHLRSMGTKGRGPGEFRIGEFIWVLPGDTLWVGDYRPWRFNVYASSGEFVRTVQLQPRMFFSAGGGVLDNGWSVNVREGRPRIDVSSPTPGLLTSPTPYRVEVQAADGSSIRQLGTLHGPRIGGPADSKVNPPPLPSTRRFMNNPGYLLPTALAFSLDEPTSHRIIPPGMDSTRESILRQPWRMAMLVVASLTLIGFVTTFLMVFGKRTVADRTHPALRRGTIVAGLLAVSLATGAQPATTTEVTPGLSGCYSDDGMACSEAQKQYVRDHVIDPACGSEGGWACVTCYGLGSIKVHSVGCGAAPESCPPV